MRPRDVTPKPTPNAANRDFAQRYPILAEHVGLPGPQPSIRDLRFQRDVSRLHRLGPRALHELLREIGATRQIQTYVEQRAAAFAAVDPDQLAATGGDRFPAWPVREVRS